MGIQNRSQVRPLSYMKIYILEDPDYDGVSIEGVFSTREKAVAALPYHNGLNEDSIVEHEVDPVYSGEIYENYFYCNVRPSGPGEIMWGDAMKRRASEVIPFNFIESHIKSIDHTQGWGKTPEEAESNARHAQTLLHPIWQIWKKKNGDGDYYSKHLPHPSLIYKEMPGTAYAVHEDFNVAKIAVMEYEATGKLSPFLTVPPKV